MEKKKGKNFVFNIIIVVLSVMLILLTFTFAAGVFDYQRDYIMDEEDMIYYVRFQNYHYLTEQMYYQQAKNVKPSEDMKMLYAVAHYYENAVMYQAYAESGESQKAQEKYEKMQQYEGQMGDYAFAKEDIWNLLGITE